MTLLACLLFALADPKPTADYVADLTARAPEIRAAAVAALKARPDAAKLVVRELVKSAEGPDAYQALGALHELGPVARDALPALKELAKARKDDGRLAGAMLALSDGADRDAVRYALTVRGGRAQAPGVDLYAINQYPFGLACALTDLVTNDRDPTTRADAAEALGHFGVAVREGLEAPLARAGTAGRRVAPTLEAALRDPDVSVRRAAVLSLPAVNPSAIRKALPTIVALIRTNHLSSSEIARPMLPHLASAAPVLVAALADADEATGDRLAGILAEFRGPAIPLLVPSLKHADAGVRRGVACALGWMRGVGEDVTLPLVAALDDPDPDVRLTAAEGLTLGRKAKAAAAVPVLVAALGRDTAAVRGRAALALRPVGTAAKPAVPALLKVLADPDAAVALFAARSLAAIDPPSAGPAVPVMADRGLAASSDVRSAVADELGHLGPIAKAALPRLKAMFRDPHPVPRRSAAVAAARIDPSTADAATAALMDLLDTELTKLPTEQLFAFLGLRDLGPAAKSAVPTLERRLAAAREEHLWYVAGTLLAIDPTHAAAAAVLRKELATGDAVALEDVYRGIDGLGPAAVALVPDLLPFLGHKDVYARGSAAEFLADIGPAAKAALPALRAQMSREQEKYARERIERAIQAVGGVSPR